jgi:hypothetical protein
MARKVGRVVLVIEGLQGGAYFVGVAVKGASLIHIP